MTSCIIEGPDGHYQPEQDHQITQCTVQPRCSPGERYVDFGVAEVARCLPCLAQTFMAAENHANAVCIPYSDNCDVAAGQTEVVAPTSSQDRICDTSEPCAGIQYETQAATPSTNRQCASLTLCTSGQHVVVDHTNTSDRVCQDCDGEEEFSQSANSATCTAMKKCGKGEYVNVQGSRVKDLTCDSCSNGKYVK